MRESSGVTGALGPHLSNLVAEACFLCWP